METLQKNQPELEITSRDIEITRIAALVHDIGHGPFSHLYDEHIRLQTEDEHEVRGCKVFQQMVQTYGFPLTKKEVKQVVMMIDPSDEVKYTWRYQIVANKMCQIDVDKLDYIRRDCYHLGIKINDTFTRLITKARVVLTPNGYKVLAWPRKLEYNIFSLFAARYRLHKQVYHHHAVKAHEFIIVEILKKLKNKLGELCWMVTDATVTCGMHKSYSHLFTKLQTRDIPKLVGEIVVKLPHSCYDPEDPNPRTILAEIIQTVKIGFASGTDNPLNQVYYYTKDNTDKGYKINPQNNSFCVPSEFQELIVRMYTKSSNMDEAKTYWQEFKTKYQ
jgi:dGTP triphosphohydrolase